MPTVPDSTRNRRPRGANREPPTHERFVRRGHQGSSTPPSDPRVELKAQLIQNIESSSAKRVKVALAILIGLLVSRERDVVIEPQLERLRVMICSGNVKLEGLRTELIQLRLLTSDRKQLKDFASAATKAVDDYVGEHHEVTRARDNFHANLNDRRSNLDEETLALFKAWSDAYPVRSRNSRV